MCASEGENTYETASRNGGKNYHFHAASDLRYRAAAVAIVWVVLGLRAIADSSGPARRGFQNSSVKDTSRTTISVDEALFDAAQRRAEALKYPSFSAYLAYLIEEDLREQKKHVTVREENPGYGRKKKSVVKEEAPAYLHVPGRYSGHLKQSAGKTARARKSRSPARKRGIQA